MNQACKSHQFYSKTSWKYHLAKWDCMKFELTNCDWNIDQDDVDAIWEKFKGNILTAMKQNIPQSVIKRSMKDQPWFNDKCSIACAKKERLWRQFQKSGKSCDKIQYTKYVDACNEIYNAAKSYYKENICKRLADENTSIKQWWRIVNNVVGQGCHTEIPSLIVNNCSFDDPKEKAELFKDIFASKATINDDGKSVNSFSLKLSKSLCRIKIRAVCAPQTQQA